MATFDPELERRLIDAGYDVDVIADVGEPPHLIRCQRGAEAVDILLPVVEYQRVALARALDQVLTAEDVIVHKLIAWRLRDRDDIPRSSSRGHARSRVPRRLDRRVGRRRTLGDLR